MTRTDPIPARIAALKTASTPELKKQWRALFNTEPPAFNRRFLETRLAYRIQELTYGGLKPDTVKRLEALGEQFDGGSPPDPDRPQADHRHPADPGMAGRRACRDRHPRRL